MAEKLESKGQDAKDMETACFNANKETGRRAPVSSKCYLPSTSTQVAAKLSRPSRWIPINTQNQCIIRNRALAQICCALGPVPCHFCCHRCPLNKESTSTRLMYFTMFIFTIALAITSLFARIPTYLAEKFTSFQTFCDWYALTTGTSCEEIFGNYSTVYKMCTGQAFMHLLLMPITFFAKNSRSCISTIHNGFWLWKWLFVILVNIALFLHLPAQTFTTYATGMRYFGLVGGCLFIMINLFFLCQVTMNFNNDLLERAKTNYTWYIAIWLMTFVVITVCGAISYVLFHFYSACIENKVIAMVNVASCCLLFLLTIISGVGRGSKNADILQGSVIISYILYQTWSAIHSRPAGEFNYKVFGLVVDSVDELTSQNANDTEGSNSTASKTCLSSPGFLWDDTKFSSFQLQYLGLAYYICVALYTSVDYTSQQAKTMTKYRNPSNKGKKKLTDQNMKCGERYRPMVATGQGLKYNELEKAIYNYSYLHFQFCCSILFVMMALTRWFNPGQVGELADWSQSWAAFWIEIMTSWLFIIIYIFNLMLPAHCQKNSYYNGVALRLSVLSRTCKSVVAPQNIYYDANGRAVADFRGYKGVVFVYDENKKLQPAIEIRTPTKQEDKLVGT